MVKCPYESSRPTKNPSGLLEVDHVNLKLNLSAGEQGIVPLKEDVGNQMTQAGGRVDLRESWSHRGINPRLGNPPPYVLITSISSLLLKSPGAFQTC